MGRNTGKAGGAESAVEERRLRPIYELLDINSNKKAVQELDRLLKKQPNFTSAKVLKALALLRLGKKSECEGIIATVVAEDVPAPTDENTIQALSICYRELDKPRSICELLERACKLDKSEDLLTHSFMAHVRVGEFQKQHQIALSLYKLYPKTPYFSWSVMSLFVKAETESDDPSSSSLRLTLPLAERMMGKFIEDNKIESDHEMHLYLLILRKQGKYEKILELLEKCSERKLGSVTGFFQKIKIDCLKQLQKSEILAQYLENLILENPDEWKYYDEYVRLCMKTESVGDVRRVRDFLESLLNSHSSTSQIQKQRPVLLTCFLFFQIIVEQNISTDWSVLPLFQLYAKHFGQKPTFFFDLISSLDALQTMTSREDLLQTMKECSEDLPTPLHPRDKIQRELNYIFLEQSLQDRDIEYSRDSTQTFDCFEILVQKYLHSLDEKTGMDDFLIIGTIKLADSFWTFKDSNCWTGFFKSRPCLKNTNDEDETSNINCNNEKTYNETIDNSLKSPSSVSTIDVETVISEISNGLQSVTLKECTNVSEEDFPVLYCIAVLNYGLFENPNNAQMRLLLSKLFIRCGAVGAASDTLKGLDLKHIQLESLGYIYIWKLIHCGYVNEGYRILNHIEHFYTTYEKESMEHILSSYKYGSWEKILEFMEFRKLLLKSAQFASVKIERRFLEYFKDATSRLESIKIAVRLKRELNLQDVFLKYWEELTDCRDLSVLSETGVRKCSELKEWEKITFMADKKKLKIRGFILILINNCVLLMENLTNENEFKNIMTIIDDTRLLLIEEFNKVDNLKEELLDVNSITGPWPPSIFEYLRYGYSDVLLKLSSLISSFIKNPGSSETVMAEMSAKIEYDLEIIINEQINSSKKFQKRKNLLEFSNILENGFDVIETLSLVCVLLDVLSFIIQKNTNANQKTKKKKGKLTSIDTCHFSHFIHLLTITSQCLVKVENELKNLTSILVQNFSSSKLENINTFWKENINVEIYSRIFSYSIPMILFNLSDSYYNSLQEMSTIIISKIKYLDIIRAQF